MTKALHPVSHWNLPAWMLQGLCSYEGSPDWWFPEKSGLAGVHETRMAISICQSCPVRLPCLAYANDHRERGIWGGLTEQQRALQRRRRKPATTAEGTTACLL